MKLYYDLHIHSALSPCGDMDMTPNNIVNMSVLKGLDVIALSDHNSAGNLRPVMQLAQEAGLLVIPAIEVETAEEIHVVCYFPTVDAAQAMWDVLKANYSGVKNRPEIFGRQCYMDAEDEITGEEDDLLITATLLPIERVFAEARRLGGKPVPAHIDRESNSILETLGMIPPELGVTTVEISPRGRGRLLGEYSQKYKVLTSSDAHYLENIAERERYLEAESKTVEDILKTF